MSGPTRIDDLGEEPNSPGARGIDYRKSSRPSGAGPSNASGKIDYTRRNQPPRKPSPEKTRIDPAEESPDLRAAPSPDVTRMDSAPSAPAHTRIDGAPTNARDTGPSTGGQAGLTLLPGEIDEHFTAIRRLGHGGEATVFLCSDDTGFIEVGRNFAIKVYDRSTPTFAIAFDSDRFAAQFRPEHSVILYRRGVDRLENRHFDIMEFCEDGTLEDILSQMPHGRVQSSPDAEAILRQIADALNGIQQPDSPNRLVHGDLKPENILVRSRDPLDLVLTDFGLSVELTNRSRASNTGRGTLSYSAPGALQSFSLPADWWSIGMIVYRTLVGRGYFTQPDGTLYADSRILEELQTEDISFEALDGLDYLDSTSAARWKLLLTGLLTRKPSQRWGYPEVDAWLRGESPSVAASALTATGRPSGSRTTATRPYAISGGAEFRTVAELATWITDQPIRFVKHLTGQNPSKLMNWIKAEFGDKWTFSAYDRSWDPHTQASYLTSQLAPEAVIQWKGHNLNARADLIALADAAAQQDSAQEVINQLFRSGLLGALESEVRPGFAAIDADWHDIVDTADGFVTEASQLIDNSQREVIRRQALAAAAGARTEVIRSVEQHIASKPEAMQIDWFRRLWRP